MMVAVMAGLMPAQALIPVHGLVQIGANGGRAAILLRQVQWQVLAPLCAGSVVGAANGGLTAVGLDPATLNLRAPSLLPSPVWVPPLTPSGLSPHLNSMLS